MSKAGNSGAKSKGNSGTGLPKYFPPNPMNRFQKSGSEAVYEVKETNTSVIYRIDLPGCPSSDLRHWIEGNNVHFFADEPTMSDYNHGGRKYGGTMVFNPVAYNVKETKAKLRDGVLWITIPKIPGRNIELTVVERMLICRKTRDNVV